MKIESRQLQSLLLSLLLLLGLISPPAFGVAGPALPIEYIGGETWYVIENAAHLAAVMNPANASTYWNARLKIADGVTQIDATAITATPIGNGAPAFSGVFDGNRAIIRINGIDQPANEEVGLFGSVQKGAVIKDLDLVISEEVSGRSHVGGLVGMNRGSIQNCRVAGDVRGESEYAGGLAGGNDGTLLNCSFNGKVAARTDGFVGGVAGINNVHGSIKSCSSRGRVAGGDYAGGITGINDHWIINSSSESTVAGGYCCGGAVGINYGEIADSGAKGGVASSADCCGGFAGFNLGIISGSKSSGDASAAMSVGGFVGNNDQFIENCYATGSPSGILTNTGGFSGYNQGRIYFSYASGTVRGGLNHSGGFTGFNNGIIEKCFSVSPVQGTHYTGGFAGFNHGSSIINCFSTGDITATGNYNGGFAGYNEGLINSCYSAGNVKSGGCCTGGFLGGNNNLKKGTVRTCYYLQDNGNENPGGINGADRPGMAVGKNIMDLQARGTFNRWNFSMVWMINTGKSFPYLIWDSTVWSGNGDYNQSPLLLWEAASINLVSLNPAILPGAGENDPAVNTVEQLQPS